MSKQNVQDIYPLAPAQQGMLLYLLLSGYRSEVYFDQLVATLDGDLDPAAFRRAWTRVVERQPALRTLFLWEKREQPLQVVRRDVELPWREEDWSALGESERQERWDAFLREDHAAGFDLRKAPLLRVALIRWAEGVHKLVWSFSHIILDGWSIALVLAEVLSGYRELRQGREPEEAPVPPYRAYIDWLQKQDLAAAESFWRRTLAGFTSPTPLPFEGSGPGGELSGWAAAEERLALPAATVEGLQDLARRERVTLNTLFQAAWALLLSRASGSRDIVFGAVVSGRPHEIEGVESTVGLFINTLPVRVQVDPQSSLPDWLRALQEAQIEQREYEHSPLEQIQAWSGVERHVPLFGSLLIFENYPVDPLSGSGDPGFTMRDARLKEANSDPLSLYINPQRGGVEIKASYHWTRFSAAAMRRLLGHYAKLLGALSEMGEKPEARLGDLSWISLEERAELLAAAAGPLSGAIGDVCIHRLVAEQAARTPEAPAVESADGGLTYRELAERAGSLARHLRGLGVGPESIVGLCAERSPEMVVAMLAVLEAGGAYLPLDPAYPRERLAFMLEDSGAQVLLTQERLLSRLPETAARIVTLDSDFLAPHPPTPSPIPSHRPGEGEKSHSFLHLERAAAPLSRGLGGDGRGDGGEGPGGFGHGPALPRSAAYVIYTSGSTGRPKGVVVEHSSLVNYVRSAAEEYAIAPGDRVLQFASISFDTSAEEIYPCLIRGGTLVLRGETMTASLTGFVRDLDRLKITALDLPTAYWHELVAEMEAEADLTLPATLRLVILGGEQALPDRLAAWHERAGNVRLVNTYGPTEATIVSTKLDVTEPPASGVPIGRPVPNARTYVLGRQDRDLLPQGLDGELWIGGAGLARGYLGRPDLTAERFAPDPFAAGERLYRSGDLARLLPDGTLEFRGRADDQVKVRGYRIELGEIEAALRRLAGVRDAVVAVREDRPGDKRLVAYVVFQADGPEEIAETSGLRAALQETLPEHMIPAVFVRLAALPLSPSGKVDRRALPAPDSSRPDLDADYAAPRGPVQEVLAGIWSELLGVERIGIHDDFFQLGGHSLLVAKLAARVRQAFQVELPIVEVFKQPTVAALAAAVEKAERGGQGGSDLLDLPPIERAPRDQPLPLSFPQERVWFLNHLTPGGNIAYNFQVTIWLRGELDVAAFHGTLEEIVRRHEVLRTSFPALDGRPVQVIHPPGPVELPLIDLVALPEERRQPESERLVFEATQKPFDVARAPLVRWRLVKLEDDLHELIQVEQHFVHDGWSFGVMLKEIKAIYPAFAARRPSPLPELPIQYADFAAWQRGWMDGPVMERMMAYWRGKLAGSPQVLELPGDRPRPSRPAFKGDITLHPIPPVLYDALRRFGRAQGFTLYMTMLSGFFSLLERYTGQEDILLGTNNANRRAEETEGLIGMIVNSLVLRGDLHGDPAFRELLGRVRETSLENYVYQDTPFERLVQELRPERQLGRNPLFQIMFNFHDAAVPDLDFGGLHGSFLVRGNRSAKMDMNVIVVPRGEQRVGLAASAADQRSLLHWEYNSDLFDFPTVLRMIGHYLTLLAGAVENPGLRLSELPLLTEGERRQLVEWNDTGGSGNDSACLHDLIAAQARRTPEATAVRCEGESLTYAELMSRAGRVARRLRAVGVGPEVPVAVALDRSLHLPVALLGVLAAGGAYVPLDPGHPRERLALILDDSGAAVLLTEKRLRPALPPAAALTVEMEKITEMDSEIGLPALEVSPDHPAYIIYTSGSTGRPKGVAVRHGGAVSFLRAMARRPGLAASDVLLAVTTVAFDIAVLELFLPLSVGAAVELAGRETAADGIRLAALLGAPAEGGGITAMQATPATWRMLIEVGWQGKEGLKALCGGEALPGDLARGLRSLVGPSGSVWNMYGPTETTVWSAVQAVDAAAADRLLVPIGRPIAGTRLHIVDIADRSFAPAPAGIPGELWIGGEGLARGYLRRADLTAERFVPDPFTGHGERLYRTGDLARFLPHGTIEFLGRIDHQVKIRGFRIEPGEIEAVLLLQPGVREAAVIAREDRPGDRRLVAYVTGTADAGALREALARALPAYMLPAAFVALESLPLNPSGKLDRRALPAPERTEGGGAGYVAPRSPVEETVAGIWAAVLGLERVGARDDFFELGGHSLTATSVLARVRDALGVELPLSVVFERRTVEGMAAAVLAAAALAAPQDDLEKQAAALSDDDLDALLGALIAEGGRA